MVLILVALSDKSTINIITNALFILLKTPSDCFSLQNYEKNPTYASICGKFCIFSCFWRDFLRARIMLGLFIPHEP